MKGLIITIAIILNLFLFLVKYIGGKLSGSVSVTADAFNNLTDAISSLFILLGLKIAALGSGSNHVDGHGKFEWLVALLTSCSVIVVGWELLTTSIDAIKDPQVTVFHSFTLCVLMLSIGIKIFLYFYNLKLSKLNHAESLRAAAADCISDAFSTSAVLLSLLIDHFCHLQLDGWCGLIVSLFIMYNGIKSFSEVSHRIVGSSPDPEKLEQLRQELLSNERIKEVHNLKIEDYGYDRMGLSMSIQPYAEVSPHEAILLCESLRAVYLQQGYKTVYIQTELSVDQNSYTALEAKIKNALSKFPYQFTIKAIRILQTDSVPHIYLTLILPFEIQKHESKIINLIAKILSPDEGIINVQCFMDPETRKHLPLRLQNKGR